MHTVEREKEKNTFIHDCNQRTIEARERGYYYSETRYYRPPAIPCTFVRSPLHENGKSDTARQGSAEAGSLFAWVLLPTCDPTQPPLLHRPLPLTRENKSDDETSSPWLDHSQDIVLRCLFIYHFLKRKRISN